MVLSGDGQPHSSIWKEIRLLLEAGGGFLYARIATMITKRITKKVKKSYFVIGHHPISGARFDRLPYRQHRVQYNISAWNPATEAHPQKSPVKEHLSLLLTEDPEQVQRLAPAFSQSMGNFIAQGVQPFAPMVRPWNFQELEITAIRGFPVFPTNLKKDSRHLWVAAFFGFIVHRLSDKDPELMKGNHHDLSHRMERPSGCMRKWSISETCDTIKKAVHLVSPVGFWFKKTRLSFVADGGFPYAPSIPLLQSPATVL